MQTGRNAGVTGLADFPGLSAKFQGRINGWGARQDGATKPRRGRGGGLYKTVRWLFSSGNGSLTYQFRGDGFPAPDAFRGQAGTITVQVDTGKTIQYPITVVSADSHYDEKTMDRPAGMLAFAVTGEPVYTGFGGTQPTATDGTRTDQEQYEGTSKTVDPQGLASSAQRLTDVWGALGDTDGAESTKLASVIASAQAPFSGMKLRSATFQRDATDGGTVLETWGLTDTAEDATNPNTHTTVDANHLASEASNAAINTTPSTPTGDSFVLRTETTNELNDAKTLKTREFGLRDTAEDITMPGTVKGNDPFDLADTATVTLTNGTSTPPSVPSAPIGQHVQTESEQVNRQVWRHTFTFRNLNSEQAIEFPEATITTDPAALTDADRQSDVSDTSSPPSAPASRFTDGKLRKVISRRVGGTPEKWLHVWEYGRRTTQEDIEMPGTVTGDEVSDIDDEATITVVTSSGTAPSTPAAPVGQLLKIESEQLHGSDGGKWRHTFTYGNTTALQRIQFPTDVLDWDLESELEDEDHQSDVSSSSALVATPDPRIPGLVLRRYTITRIAGTPEKWLHRWAFGRRLTRQDIEFPGTVTTDEVSDIADDATITFVTTSPFPADPAPAAPLGQLLDVRSEQLTDAGRWKHTFHYGNTTALQRIQFPTDVLDTDPSGLKDEDHQSEVTSSSTVPTAPATRVAGLVLRVITSKRISGTPEQWLHQWEFGRRSTEEDETFPGTVTSNEISDIADEATVTQVTSSATPPSTPAAPVGQLLEVRSEQLTDAGKWKHTFRYGNTTALQRITFPTDVLRTDPSGLEDEDVQSQTAATSTVPSTPVTRISGCVLRAVVSKRIAGTPELWLHQWTFGRRTTTEDITFPGTVTQDEVSDLGDRATITRVTTSSTPPAVPTAPVGQIVETRSEQLTDSGKWKHTFSYANTTEAQRAQFPSDKPGDDPANLEDFDLQAQVTTSITPPATPASRVIGLKLRKVTSERIGGTPAQYLHKWEFGRRTTQEDVEFPGTVTRIDQYAIDGDATIRKVTGSSTAPATPTAPVGECVLVETLQIHAGTDGEKWQHTFKYAQLNSQQRHTFPAAEKSDDPQDLGDTETQAQITTSATPPADPSPAITGLVVRAKRTRRVSGTPAYYLHVWSFGRRSEADDVTFPGTITKNEISDLADEATVTQVTSSGTPPSTPAAPLGQLVRVDSEQLTNAGKWRHTFTFANTTEAQGKTFAATVKSADANLLQSEDVQSQINNSSTPPATPTPSPATLVIRKISSRRIGGTPEQWQHTWTFGPRSTTDDVEMPDTRVFIDADNLESRAEAGMVFDAGTTTPASTDFPSLGSLGADEQVLGVEVRPLNQLKSEAILKTGMRTPKQDIEWLQSKSKKEAGQLDPIEFVVEVDSSATPTTPSNPDSTNLSFAWSETHRQTNSQYVHIYAFAPLTAAEAMTAQFEADETDPAALEDEHTRVLYGATSTPTADPGVSGQVLDRTVVKRVGKAKYRYTYHYAFRTSSGKMTADKTVTTTDLSALQSEAVTAEVWTVASGAPSTPTLSGFQLVDKTDREIQNPLYRLRVYRWGLVTNQQKVEYEATEAVAGTENPYHKRIASVVDYSGTAQALADSLLGSNKSDGTFLRAIVKKITPDKALQMLEFDGEDKLLHSQHSHVQREAVRGVPYTALGGTTIYTPGAISTSDNQAVVYVYFNGGDLQARPMFIWRAVGGFMFRRVFSVYPDTTSPIYTEKQFLAVRGMANNASFLGYSAGEVMYAGPAAVYTFAVAGQHRMVIDYSFVTDDAKFFNDGWLSEGRCSVNSGIITTSGLKLATALDAGLVCTFPGQASFAGFTT